MIKPLRVSADNGRVFRPLADHVQHFTKVEIPEFSTFPFSFQLMLDQTLTNLIVCLMISNKNYIKQSCTNELACGY